MFHPEELLVAQRNMQAREGHDFVSDKPLHRAEDYFVCAWMGRSAQTGTDAEFSGGLAVRWDAGGGDSVVRYRSAVRGLVAWRKVLARAQFSCLDFRLFLDKCHDEPKHGIYCDSPWPGPGEKYKHKFTPEDHAELAKRLAAFKFTRCVCRFYDHPMVRELYPESIWEWRHLTGGKKQSNKPGPEVLLVKRPVVG